MLALIITAQNLLLAQKLLLINSKCQQPKSLHWWYNLITHLTHSVNSSKEKLAGLSYAEQLQNSLRLPHDCDRQNSSLFIIRGLSHPMNTAMWCDSRLFWCLINCRESGENWFDLVSAKKFQQQHSLANVSIDISSNSISIDLCYKLRLWLWTWNFPQWIFHFYLLNCREAMTNCFPLLARPKAKRAREAFVSHVRKFISSLLIHENNLIKKLQPTHANWKQFEVSQFSRVKWMPLMTFVAHFHVIYGCSSNQVAWL